jgi:hydroxymethylpyrimidine/phosphomethylpyrimidine kinase
MAKQKLNPADYLKPRDPATLVSRRGRRTSTFYPDLVKAFVDAGEAAMDVDVAKIGRKPETVRSALAKAIRSAGVRDTVRVSKFGDDVILVKR